MSSTQTRRPPNAMNFIRQLEVLQKSGESQDFEVAVNKSKSFSDLVFDLRVALSNALLNLSIRY